MKGKRFGPVLITALGLLILILTCSGCLYASEDEKDKLPYLGESLERAEGEQVLDRPEVSVIPLAETGEKTRVVLYFADQRGNLVAEPREITRVKGIARRTMQELCRGPAGEGRFPVIPAGVEVKDINISDGLATVNFSRELTSSHGGGSSGELLTVYAIVNTLTQFQTVERVQILVDGRKIETLAGHVDISVPLARDGHLIGEIK